MSAVDMIERQDERWKRRVAFLLATLLLVVSVFIGWSRLAGDESEAQVLGEILTGRGNSGESNSGSDGNSTPGQGQENNPGNGQPAPPGGNPNNAGSGPAVPPGSNPRTFGISGKLQGIYPTFDESLRVMFTNPHRFDIVVTELTVQPQVPTTECSVDISEFTIAPLPDDGEWPDNGVLVSKRTGNTAGTQSVHVGFKINDLPDGCQGKSFRLDYTGTAIRANQP